MSNADLVQYIIEQASQAGEVRARKMFGDYCLYCNDKPVGLICDDYLYLKPLKQLDSVLREDDRQMRPPYDGAKPHYAITDVDDADYVSLLVKTVVENLPSKKR
ncbi:MAG: TfoX/Sxy family protein [Paludibacteraceae bacterium]|nr:TfoX/Sxy family protein [Paludibacteraceae bacterium]